MVGYRWFDDADIDPLFEFGYGLSYTEFDYSDLKIRQTDSTTFEVSYKVTNIGDVAGKEVSQVYVNDVSSMVVREPKALKGFSKDFLKPGESKIVKVILDKYAFSYYDVSNKAYYVENGYFNILVGASSRDIRLDAKVKIDLNKKYQNSIR